MKLYNYIAVQNFVKEWYNSIANGYDLTKVLSTTVWSVKTKQFTAKCPFDIKSHSKMSLRRSVLTAKCPYREVFSRRSFLTAICPYGEVSIRRSVHTAKCPYSEVSIRRNVLRAKCPTANSPTAKSSVTEISMPRIH